MFLIWPCDGFTVSTVMCKNYLIFCFLFWFDDPGFCTCCFVLRTASQFVMTGSSAVDLFCFVLF